MNEELESDEFGSFTQKIAKETTRKQIIWIEYLSILLTIVCCILSALLAIDENSVIALAVSIDSLLDIVTYVIVLWRFQKPYEENVNKEKVSLILLSVLFFISSFWIEIECLKNFLNEKKPEPSFLFIMISCSQSLTFSIISIVKFYLAKKFMYDPILISDGINSLVTSISSFSMALSMGIYLFNCNIWYFDSIFGILIGFLVFMYGCRLLIKQVIFKS